MRAWAQKCALRLSQWPVVLETAFMNKSKIAYGVAAVVLLGLALALNPSADRHRKAMREAVDGRSQLESALGLGQLTAFMSRYESLGVASYSTLNGEVVTVGALGMVFVTN
jgi:hypothetical protein